MTEFLVYIVFPIVLFLFIRTVNSAKAEERSREIEREEEERKKYERELIEHEKKSIRRRREMFWSKKDKT